MANKNEPPHRLSRRTFMQKTALAGTAVTAATLVPPPLNQPVAAAVPATFPSLIRSLNPTMSFNETVSVSKPLLDACPLSFRIGLARTRMSAYPCDAMDFVMMDLERPENKSRHAHWCTGDLTGRLLEFLCCAEGVDGKTDPRLHELFERMLKQQRPSGLFGRFPASTQPDPESDPIRFGASSKVFHGMVRYYELTGDLRALAAAERLAELHWSIRAEWAKRLQSPEIFGDISPWIGEPFARLYGIKKDPRWLEFCALIRDHLQSCENRACHSHGFLSTLRGLQELTLSTGDLSWNEPVEQNVRIIIEKGFALPDGNIPERFPTSQRNEGCSIADWLMVNLNQGLIHNDEQAYDRAERIFWNALAFNQLITGGFGHRRITANGYGVDKIHEAWWCCTQNAGMAMAHFARHSVTLNHNAIQVNFLTPGQYQVPLPGGKWAWVKIQTEYPQKAEATIEADNLPSTMKMQVRIPSGMKQARIMEKRNGQKCMVTLTGKIGHRIEECHPGIILTYGPLVVAPGRGAENTVPSAKDLTDGIPAGYVPQSLPPGTAEIVLDQPPDADGFVKLPTCPPERPLPAWSYYDEGPGSRTGVEGAAVEVTIKYADGKLLPVRFVPLCFCTSCLSLFETPVLFRGWSKKA